MKKFTVFTIILTVIVVLVFGEMFVKEYFPGLVGEDTVDSENVELTLPEGLSANVLGSDLKEEIPADAVESVGDEPKVLKSENLDILDFPESKSLGTNSNAEIADSIDIYDLTGDKNLASDDTGVDGVIAVDDEIPMEKDTKDFEDENFASVTSNVYLREEQIKSAGFVQAYLENEPFDGRLYKTISVDDLSDVEITKTVIRNKDALLAKVYIFKAGVDSNINEIYQLVKLRAGQGLGTATNETNDFGLASFYLNDPNRSETAFLTVRVAGLIYAFSYPKEYHAQVKNLIMLIEWELG